MPFVERVGLMLFVAGPVSQPDGLQPPLLVEAASRHVPLEYPQREPRRPQPLRVLKQHRPHALTLGHGTGAVAGGPLAQEAEGEVFVRAPHGRGGHRRISARRRRVRRRKRLGSAQPCGSDFLPEGGGTPSPGIPMRRSMRLWMVRGFSGRVRLCPDVLRELLEGTQEAIARPTDDVPVVKPGCDVEA